MEMLKVIYVLKFQHVQKTAGFYDHNTSQFARLGLDIKLAFDSFGAANMEQQFQKL